MRRSGFLGFAVCFALLIGACSQKKEEQAKSLFNEVLTYADAKEFESAIRICQKIIVDFGDTSLAPKAENMIGEYERLQSMFEEKERLNVVGSFRRIARAIEQYEIRFLTKPVTPEDLNKLPEVIVPEWVDPWGHAIYYKPLYSSTSLPKHTPDGYVLASFGKDGLPGGDGLSRDRFFMDGKEVTQILGDSP